MKRMPRVLALAGISLLLATGSVVVTTSAAQAAAAPYDCNPFVGTDMRGYAKCTKGTGYYKVGIACKSISPFGFYGWGFTQEGNWARVGGTYQSVAQCPLGTTNWSPTGSKTHYAWINRTAEKI